MSVVSKYLSLMFFLFIGAVFLIPCGEAYARDVRGYTTPPDGTAGVIFYTYQRSADEQYVDGKKVNTNADFSMNLQMVRPVYYKEICGYMTSVQMLLPFGNASATVGGTKYSASGLADPTILFGFFPIADREKQMWLGLTEYITMPIGDYRGTSPVNIGANRWAFKTEMGFVKGFGKLFIDIVPKVEFYTDNRDHFFVQGGGIPGRKQVTKPLYGLETHLSYDFTKEFLLSLDYYWDLGGKHKTDGVKYGKRDNHAVQLTAGIRIAPQHQLLIQYMQTVKVENGYKTNQFGVRYFYIF